MTTIKLLVLALFTNIAASAQVTFENSYNATGSNKDFGIAKVDSVTYFYYYLDYNSSTFTLYNLNHSVAQTVTIPVTYTNNVYKVQYITRSLFDCDNSNLEYLLNYNDYTTNTQYVRVYRTDGTQLFNADSSQAQLCFGCSNIVNNYIVNTPDGAKMMLRHSNGLVNVYGLCGMVPNVVKGPEDDILGEAFPNPARSKVTIPYTLPRGENKATIKLFDMSGHEVKSFNVDGNFKNIVLTTSDIPQGTYLYQLQTSGGIKGSKKLVKVD